MNENQYGVLLENLIDKVNAIAEGQRIMEDKFEKRFDGMESRFDRVETRLDRVKTRLERVEKDIKIVKQDTEIIKSHLAAIEDSLNDHERRITRLEIKAVRE